jgi:hypothetical protein
MSATTLEAAQAALAENVRAIASCEERRLELEKSIATAQARLVDLEAGRGAPNDVPSWLKLKSTISNDINTASAERVTVQAQVNELGRAQSALASACDAAIEQEQTSYFEANLAKLNELLAQAAPHAARCGGYDLYLRHRAERGGVSEAESIRLHRLANTLIARLPPACGYLGINIAARGEAERRWWAALADRLAHPEPEDTATTAEQAAELN